MTVPLFDARFQLLTGRVPFPWQRRLYNEFVGGKFPPVCAIPTGLGKTSVLAIWLLALAERAEANGNPDFPRRIVYIVNRRTVVDQATREAEELRTALNKPEMNSVANPLARLAIDPSDVPLAISTLRGEFADNAEWRMDPARPAIIVGTVDMIGSRLLFSGYGRGFKSRPLHAGFLGQDALLVHDEAHLEPAFQTLLESIVDEQRRARDFRPVRVMALTATSRRRSENMFELAREDQKHEELARRTGALKGLALHAVPVRTDIAHTVADLALQYADSDHAILLYLRELKDVEAVCDKLAKAGLHDSVRRLTGTIRGYERDQLIKDPVFARFLPNAQATTGTVFLVSTSAGEVGVDISADHLVCDLTPLDALAQRLGRVNRFGRGDARIDVVYGPPTSKTSLPESFERALTSTLSRLWQLPQRPDGRLDASPFALSSLFASLSDAERDAAFTPSPGIRPTSDVLFDCWVLTSIRGRLPGRPPVADWLHGIATWEPPETNVAWRREVGELREWPADELTAMLDDYPVKPHELLRDRSDRVLQHLKAIAERAPALPVWLVSDEREIESTTLRALVDSGTEEITDRTVLLPPQAGGLDLRSGMLSGRAEHEPSQFSRYDIADLWFDEQGRYRRLRVWDNPASDDRRVGMRLIRVVELSPEKVMDESDDEPLVPRRWYWYVRPGSADDDGSQSARAPQTLTTHAQDTSRFASQLVNRLGVGATEAHALAFAALHHDDGKDVRLWQRSIGNSDYPRVVLAKSAGALSGIQRTLYRHEFGSLHRIVDSSEFRTLDFEAQDLTLHLVASHHGRARPHFDASEMFAPDCSDGMSATMAEDVLRRFARLQRKYGRWGLAYLESLLRAADALASAMQPGNEDVRQAVVGTATELS